MSETPETPEVETTEAEIPVETTDLSVEVEKWKSLSRKNEQQAKANAAAAKELEELAGLLRLFARTASNSLLSKPGLADMA